MRTMKERFQAIKTYLAGPGKELFIGIGVVAAALFLITVITLIIQNSGTKIVYPPVKACDLFTSNEAKELLGDKVIPGTKKDASLAGDTVTTQCSYTDANEDTDNLIVAAIAVRSGVNEKGVQRNKSEFALGRAAQGSEVVNDLGDSAYFNRERGQLNVLNGYDWIIVSYGVGTEPEANSLDKAIELANKVLKDPVLPTF